MDTKDKTMEDSMAIANYFIEKASSNGTDITLLKLVKLVYLAHGYILALMGRSYLSRFDRVEAWKFGPVIPTVYHSFKYCGATPIKNPGIVVKSEDGSDYITLLRPQAKEEIKPVLDFVWNRYSSWSATELIELLHKKGSPWQCCYVQDENALIPDELTKIYYQAVFNSLTNN